MRPKTLGIVVALSFLLSPTITALPALAAEGMEVTADVIYTPDSFSQSLHTELSFSLRNVEAPTRSGATTTNYFFDGYSFGVHYTAENIRVEQAGVPASFDIETDEEGAVIVVVDFESNLNYREVTALTVNYDIPGTPRTDNLTRVNGALVSAQLYAWGDLGRGSVTVRLPDGHTPEFAGAHQLLPSSEEPQSWVETDIADPAKWWAVVDARNNELLTIVPLTLGSQNIVVRAWPTDSEWLETATDVITAGQPAMIDLLGLEWPIQETLIVQESIDPTLSGYGGWFFTNDALIEIGEHLDANLILHEVSHAWFNDNMFHSRWIGEGLAEYYGRKTAEVIGDGGGIASEPLSFHPDRFDLSNWPDPSSGADQGKEIWGYDTSFYIIQTVAEEIGEEAMRDVLQVAYDHGNPYSPDLEGPQAIADWRRFLDMLEEVGGSTVATGLFSDWVLPESKDEQLDERQSARDQYQAVTNHAGDWTLPLAVAENMSRWSFDNAKEQLDEAETVLTLRDRVEVQAKELGLQVPDLAEIAFEASDESYEESAAILYAELASLDKSAEALRASQTELTWLHELGLYQQDLQKELVEARDALEAGNFDQADAEAQELIDLMAGAKAEGERRAKKIGYIAGSIFIGLFALLLALRTWRRNRQTQLIAPAPTAESTPTSERSVNSHAEAPE